MLAIALSINRLKYEPLYIYIILLGTVLVFNKVCTDGYGDNSTEKAYTIRVPTSGNAWLMNEETYIKRSSTITSDGVRNWNNSDHIIRTYIYIKEKGEISLGLSARIQGGNATIRVLFNHISKEVQVKQTEFKDIHIGNFKIDNAGYYSIDFVGLEKKGEIYADINDILVGKVNEGEIIFIKDDFYWGRRGPSAHLNYLIPGQINNIDWFYSELMIPSGQDVIGSYFMANGFGEGYFGIQVNSPTERRILFSIWSPFKTDDPSEIPEEYKIRLLKKGIGVTTREFGNEGSGGQSYKVFSWKPDINYGFLVGARPTADNQTVYTAYFYHPEENSWNLIAQFSRPKTSTYLTRLHSFLENFIPDQGVFDRKGIYNNQWVHNASGWHEINQVRFTADNTARKGNRLDYSCGIENNVFYLKNCGFTNDNTPIDTTFERNKSGIAPVIDFNLLD